MTIVAPSACDPRRVRSLDLFRHVPRALPNPCGSPRAAALCAMVLLLLLAGCSSTKFAYNRLDFLLPWYLERYVDLDREQADWLDGRIDGLLAWHRAEELPKYVHLLGALEADLAQPLSLAQIQAYTDALEVAWYRIRDPGLEELLALGEQLSDAQIEAFIGELRERQEKYEKKYLDRTDEEFRDDAADSLRDSLEDYLGRLTDAQRDRVRATVDALARTDSEWLDERAAWVDEMARMLKRESGWQAAIRRTIRDWESQLDATTLAVYDRNTLLVQELVVAVVNDRTERQDRRLRNRITDLREDFASLHAEGG